METLGQINMKKFEFDVKIFDIKLITGAIGLPITLSTICYMSYISYRNKYIAKHYKLALLLLVAFYI